VLLGRYGVLVEPVDGKNETPGKNNNNNSALLHGNGSKVNNFCLLEKAMQTSNMSFIS
jgi:hypothetical protein